MKNMLNAKSICCVVFSLHSSHFSTPDLQNKARLPQYFSGSLCARALEHFAFAKKNSWRLDLRGRVHEIYHQRRDAQFEDEHHLKCEYNE